MFNVIDFESGEKIDFIVRKNTEFTEMNLKEEAKSILLVLRCGSCLWKTLSFQN